MKAPCPFCGAPVDESARGCPVCRKGIAVVNLRATIHGEARTFRQRVSCEPDEVEFIDGTEAEIDNPEDLPGREN